MKKLLASGVGLVFLAVIALLLVINTVQLHRIESRLAEGPVVSSAGPTVTSAAATPKAPVSTGTCNADIAEDLADPRNLLRPWVSPPGVPPAKVAYGGTLRRQIAQDPPGLNVIVSDNAADVSELYRYIGARLGMMSPHDPDSFYPDLARKVTRSEDKLIYDVYLRKGVKWARPATDANNPRHAWLNVDHEVVADDFVFSLEVIKNPQVLGRAAALRPYFDTFTKIDVVDPHHFRVTLSRAEYTSDGTLLDALIPMPRWLYQFDEDGKPLDASSWGEKLNSHWYNQRGIGSGAYRFVTWEPGARILLEKNPDWHLAGCQPQAFDKVELTMVKDAEAWLRYLKTKKIDYTQVQPAQYVASVRGKEPYLDEPGLKLTVHEEPNYFYIGWNRQRPFLADRKVRNALTMALDRASLVDNVFGGLGKVTSGPFLQSSPCYDASIQPLPYDLARAAALLEEAGWVDGDKDGVREKTIDGKVVPASFSLIIYGNSVEFETVARVYREALLSIGVKMDARPLEWAAQLKATSERDFDAFTGAWVPEWRVDLAQIWHSREADKVGSSNYVSFRDPEADKLIDALRLEFDEAKRVEICHAFHKLVHEDQPYTFFYQRSRAVLHWDYIDLPFFSKINPARDLRFFSFNTRP